MKKTFFSFALFLLTAITAFAQAPQKFNYQGIARKSDGNPMTNQNMSLRLTLHDISAAGTVLYQETHKVTTNQYGLYVVAVGSGTVIAGSLTSINWGTGDKYMQVEIDPTNGSDFATLGAAQLMSVPFAMYATTALNATNATNLLGTVPMAGDVTGTNAVSTVVKLQGRDINAIAPTGGQVLAWNSVTNVWEPTSAGSGTVTTITAAPPLTGGVINTTGTIGLGTAGTPGTYGSGTTVPQITTDVYGRVIGVVNTPITVAGTGTVTSITAGTGLNSAPSPITTSGVINLSNTTVAPGTYGSAVKVPQIAVDAQGRITSATDITITTSSASGTTNFISKFTAPTTLGNSQVFDDGSSVGVNTSAPGAKLDVQGSSDISATVGPFPFNHQTLIAQTGTTATTEVSRAIVGYADNSDVENHGIFAAANSTTGYNVGAFCWANPTFGTGGNCYGVYGSASGGFNNYGVYGVANPGFGDMAGYFDGDVTVTGDFTVAGIKAFKMDHPLDPANKYLYHSCVESPDMMNIYNGNITTDAAGVAVVTLPSYFDALNKDFRYQLTVIGTFAQAIVSKEVSGNQFEVKTSVPNVKVSWQVTGVRNDPYANAHRLVPEVEKAPRFKGYYFNASVWGQPASKNLGTVTAPKGDPRAK